MNNEQSSSMMNAKIDSTLLNADDVLNELQRNTDEKNIKIYQKLLGCSTKNLTGDWQPVLLKLLELIAKNTEPRNQCSILASQTLFTITASTCTIADLTTQFEEILNLNTSTLNAFEGEFKIADLDLYKLTIIHGHLFGKNKIIISLPSLTHCFEIIHKYCMTYTKYTYFAFKLLDYWLKKTNKTEFWCDNDPEIENKLEAVIFSNWDNCINEIAKINASDVFPAYLRIMIDKYDGFLEHIFRDCIDNLSWQRKTKFVILAEIIKLWNGLPEFNDGEINLIFQSLTKHHLKHSAAKLYLIVLSKMNEEKWNKTMRDCLYKYAKIWEQDDNVDALEILWELTMKPTVNKFKMSIIPSLWHHFCVANMIVCQSYLAKISSDLGVSWNDLNSEIDKIGSFKKQSMKNKVLKYWLIDPLTKIPPIFNDARDCVRLNVFALYCHKNDFFKNDHNRNNFIFWQHFLFFNANVSSMKFRKGMLDSFKILLENILINTNGNTAIRFMDLLYYVVADSIEPGSCYQRRIIGLKLLEITLSCTAATITPEIGKNKIFWHGYQLRRWLITKKKKHLQDTWTFFNLLRLCLDPIDEVRELSFNLIEKYYRCYKMLDKQIETLTIKANQMSTSSKFYELAGGVKLLKFLMKNNCGEFKNKNAHDVLFEKAQNSFTLIKVDFLKALTEGSDLNGSLAAILEINFQESLTNTKMTAKFIENLQEFLDNTTSFYLSLLSSKSADTMYSSSFAEMGIAIDQAIKNSEITDDSVDNTTVSPAQQIVISCIWLGLKTFCDLAAKISTLNIDFNSVKRSVDLIVNVLMKCRHKGIIEAAGVALGVSMRHLTVKQEFNCLFDDYLDKLLSLDSNDKIDLTRRGAGLSIMFHRMMVNDNREHRLLYIALRRLMDCLRVTAKNEMQDDVVKNKDSPCARQLYFLRTIVVDKTLHIHLVPYIEEISMICFEHLQSSEWAIRNASLQLLGAVIPRLVGQATESELDFGSGYLINHFVTHYPTLSKYVLLRIKDPSAFNIDGYIVPIITLLSKMSVGGCDFTDYSSQAYTLQTRNALWSLFGHPVDHVRFLAAKTYATLIPIRNISQELIDMKGKKLEEGDRNFLHGHLLAQICIQLSAKYEGIWMEYYPYFSDTKKLIAMSGERDIIRAKSVFEPWINSNKEFETKPLCNIIAATFLQNLSMLPLTWTEDNFILKPAELITIMERALEKKNIGISEFINRLLKFNSLFVHIDNVTETYLAKCLESNYDDIKYYSIKHLHPKLKLPFTEKHGKVMFVRGRFKLFSQLLKATAKIEDKLLVVEIAKLLIRVMNYDMRNRCEYLRYVSYQIGEAVMNFSAEILKNYKSKKIEQLAHMLTAFSNRYISTMTNALYEINYVMENKLLGKNGAIRAILRAIEDGDEQDRIWAIDCLIHIKVETKPEQLRLLKALVLLSSDVSNEVRKAFSQKLRYYEWLPKWRSEGSGSWSTDNWVYEIAPYPVFTTFPGPEASNKYQLYHYPSSDNDTDPTSAPVEFEWQDTTLPVPMPIIPQYYFHTAINAATEMHGLDCYYGQVYDRYLGFNDTCIHETISAILPDVKNRVSCRGILASPFDQDEVYQELSKIGTLFSFFVRIHKSPYPINYTSIVIMNYAILAEYMIHQRRINDRLTKFEMILDMTTENYMRYQKKRVFDYAESRSYFEYMKRNSRKYRDQIRDYINRNRF